MILTNIQTSVDQISMSKDILAKSQSFVKYFLNRQIHSKVVESPKRMRSLCFKNDQCFQSSTTGPAVNVCWAQIWKARKMPKYVVLSIHFIACRHWIMSIFVVTYNFFNLCTCVAPKNAWNITKSHSSILFLYLMELLTHLMQLHSEFFMICPGLKAVPSQKGCISSAHICTIMRRAACTGHVRGCISYMSEFHSRNV